MAGNRNSGRKFSIQERTYIGPNKDILFISRDYNAGNGNWYGTFECPYCHKSFQTRLKRITSGQTKSCGCHNFNINDITGQIFGNLQVVELSDKKYKTSRDAIWRCKCVKCGQENIELTKAHLERGDCQHCENHHGKDGACGGGRIPEDLTNQKFGKLTAIKYLGDSKWKCLCDCGNETVVKTSHLKSGATLSCGCIGSSLGEDTINSLLKELNIEFEQEKSFESCRFKDTGRLARFDFYLPKYNILIEYNGEQHYIYRNSGWMTKDKVKAIQKRDNYKIQWCKNNNIPLIIIPYTDYNKLNKEYLFDLIVNKYYNK